MDEFVQSGVTDTSDRSTDVGEQPTTFSSGRNENGSSISGRSLSIGEVLFREGNRKCHLHQILAGVVCVYQPRIGRSDEVIEFVFPGDVLGLGYLEHQIYWARAIVRTQIKCLPLNSLDRIVEYDHRAKQRHVEALNREFTYRRDLFTASNRRNPTGRVAAFLLAVSQFNKDEGRDPNIVTDSFKSGVVAEWLRLDLDDLRRALVELKVKRLIEPCEPLGLRLNDPEGLQVLADGGSITLQ
jgi:CRP/FNR family transcriptional regulator